MTEDLPKHKCPLCNREGVCRGALLFSIPAEEHHCEFCGKNFNSKTGLEIK